MRDCTRDEMAKFGTRYTRLAKKMKPRQTVGEAFTEEQVKKLVLGD